VFVFTRQGAAGNATVVGVLPGDLVSRGLDFTEPQFYVLDGGKALTAAVKTYAGESATSQRRQVRERRNVPGDRTDEQKPGVAKRLNAAYAVEDDASAKQALRLESRKIDSWLIGTRVRSSMFGTSNNRSPSTRNSWVLPKAGDTRRKNKPQVAQVARQGCELILSSQWPEKAGRGLIFLSLMVDDLDEFRGQLEKQGTPIEDGYWGYPLLIVRDPDGNIFYFAYPKEKGDG